MKWDAAALVLAYMGKHPCTPLSHAASGVPLVGKFARSPGYEASNKPRTPKELFKELMLASLRLLNCSTESMTDGVIRGTESARKNHGGCFCDNSVTSC